MVLVVIVVLIVVVTAWAIVDLRHKTASTRKPLGKRINDRWRHHFPEDDDGTAKTTTDFTLSSWWSRSWETFTDYLDEKQFQRLILGYTLDKKGRVDKLRFVFSNRHTAVGIGGGAPGSGKSSTILAENILRWGRDIFGKLLVWFNGEGKCVRKGSPLLLMAPKPELLEIGLESRLQQGTVQIFCPDGPTLAFLPKRLLKYVATWTPMSECGTWDGAQAMAEALTAGTGTDPFWENSASRTVATDLWTVCQRGSGGNLLDAYDAITLPREMTYIPQKRETGPNGEEIRGPDGEVVVSDVEGAKPETRTIDPLKALHSEIKEILAGEDAAYAEVRAQGMEPSPKLKQRYNDARIAMRAIADLAYSQAGQTNSSIITTAATALSAALRAEPIEDDNPDIPDDWKLSDQQRAGVPSLAWDAEDTINIEKMLLDSSGTIAVIGTSSGMRATRPLTTAFLNAVKRHVERRAIGRHKGQLERQMLVVVDELPVIIGSGEIWGEWCATARSSGVVLLWASQDLSSLDDSWGKPLRNKVINNTPDRLFFPGIADEDTLKLAELLAGDHLVTTRSSSTARNTGRSSGETDSTNKGTSTTESTAEQWRPLLPAGRLAAMGPGQCVLISTSKRYQVITRQWFNDTLLTSLKETGKPPPAPVSYEEAGAPR